MTIGDRIRLARQHAGFTQEDLAKAAGTSKQTIYKYEMNIITNIPSDRVEAIAQLLEVSPAYLMGWEEPPEKIVPIRVPVYGTVPAGVPIEALENILDYEELDPREYNPNKQYMGLQVKGDSMFPRYQDGDIVIVEVQPDCESGQDCIVYVNGYDATLKTVLKRSDSIELRPFNPSHPSKVYTKDDEEIIILGVVKELRRKIL